MATVSLPTSTVTASIVVWGALRTYSVIGLAIDAVQFFVFVKLSCVCPD